MSYKVYKYAIVDDGAEIGDGVEIGPYAIIGPDVKIGEGTIIGPGVIIEKGVKIGKYCKISPGVIIGGLPQDLKYKGEESSVVIGDYNVIREYVTINRSSKKNGVTYIGNKNFLMAYVHIAHDCIIGNEVVIANSVGLSGHTVVEDKASLGGFVGVHQFVRIGKMAMIGGYSKIVQDIPPFMLADGKPAVIYGLNTTGLKRQGINSEVREELKKAHRLIYRAHLPLREAIAEIEKLKQFEEIKVLLNFLKAKSLRGILLKHKRSG